MHPWTKFGNTSRFVRRPPSHLAELRRQVLKEGDDDKGHWSKVKCRHCSTELTARSISDPNLKTHRDGGKGRRTCSGRKKAIAGGARLPPTWKERQESALAKVAASSNQAGAKTGNRSIAAMLLPAFDTQVLQRLLVVYSAETATPWTFMEHRTLRLAFSFCNPEARLVSDTWAAQLGAELHDALHLRSINELKASAAAFTCCSVLTLLRRKRPASSGSSTMFGPRRVPSTRLKE
jgi:hypothetical protein